ncbi:hypothetical protein MNB_SM-3-751 [hydrothermal vent metagenome]|uniref:NnrS protein involved in response to NO n=1 Tax=hydrothermal vent metagenome TaxID=652676 RepID=A0A1W1D347_9ZZZZ
MTQISQDFAPPFKLIAPFFIIGGFFYLISSFFLFSFDVENLSFLSPKTISFIHMFLLGFVMMVIFGAMAQLVPVVLEVGHFAVELFYAIWPLLLIGTILMVFGFLYAPGLVPYGGVVVLISMMIFVMEIFMTISKVKELSLVMSSVLISNTFLFFGIIVGLTMALGFAGVISVDIFSLLRSHVYLVIGGYIGVTIMGISIVLLPMFMLSHGFSLKPLKIAIWMMSSGVSFVVLSSFIHSSFFEYVGYLLSIFSLFVYFYLIFIIYKTRPRKENDVYIFSLYFSYGAMIVGLLFALLYFMTHKESILLASGWLFFYGFFAFLISGHIYKIIPFLVWFERFSPLVGKQKVPMLADMVPVRGANLQFIASAMGVVLVTFALLAQSNTMMGAGVSFLVVGAFALIKNIFYMINFR